MAFCLEKQKDPIGGRRKRQDGEGGMQRASHRWMDGWMGGGEGGGNAEGRRGGGGQ